MSFSFSNVFHSLLPFIPEQKTKTAHVVAHKVANPAPHAAAHTAHPAHVNALTHPHSPAHPKIHGVVQWHLPIPGQNGKLS